MHMKRVIKQGLQCQQVSGTRLGAQYKYIGTTLVVIISTVVWN